MNNLCIYHNPRCSKSRSALVLLKGKNLNPKIVLYLEKKFTKEELKTILKKLNITPKDLLRSTEKEFKEKDLSKSSLSDNQIIEIMLNCPKLIQRPIVVNGSKAIVARPPEKVFEII